MSTNLEVLERDLQLGVDRLLSRRRRRRLVSTAAVAALAVAALATVAVASTTDLRIDLTKWTILSHGGTGDGRGEFVNAQNKEDGGRSSFFVQHDADLSPYEAFLLFERNQAAAGGAGGIVPGDGGDVCSQQQLTRAEQVALATLRAGFAAGAKANETKAEVDSAVSAAFGGSPCRGLDYAGERARFVYAGVEPDSNLMPGAR
jgi:hypothetical protein